MPLRVIWAFSLVQNWTGRDGRTRFSREVDRLMPLRVIRAFSWVQDWIGRDGRTRFSRKVDRLMPLRVIWAFSWVPSLEQVRLGAYENALPRARQGDHQVPRTGLAETAGPDLAVKWIA
jgi:hypothetical protein